MTVGVRLERAAHRVAIASRCTAMLEAGLVDEVQALWARGYGADLAPLRTLGYRHIGRHLRSECSLADALEEMTRDTCRYAKRQLTWFRADTGCRWYDAAQGEGTLVETARQFLQGNGP
jgi:tRNA dimethylallyltransferase